MVFEGFIMVPKKIFSLLSEICYSIDAVATCRVAAALIYKNDIVSLGWCRNKTHPLQARFGKNEGSVFLHAEVDCIQRSIKNKDIDYTKSVLFVARVKKYGHIPFQKSGWGTARPCSGCARMILAYQIPKVYYTIDSVDSMEYICESYRRVKT